MCDLKSFEQRLEMNRKAFDRIRQVIGIGSTERDVLREIRAVWDQAAGRPVPFSGDIVSGERSGAIEGEAGDRILRRGDVMIVDTQPGYDGCYADTTRTFFVGEITPEAHRAYSAVRDAMAQMEKVLRPGTPACRIHAVMQETLGRYGYACPHHAGHAVGAEKLLEPRFVPECDDTLTEGMLVTLEPGIYAEGLFGVRIENNYRITKDGCEELFRYPLDEELFVIGDAEK